MKDDLNEILREKFLEIVKNHNLRNEKVIIKTKVLSNEEAIGNPLDRDYPLLKGKERLIQANYKNSAGVAFTDIYGNYEDYLYGIIEMDLSNNFRRAIFISVINAVLRDLNLIERTAHCKDNDLLKCRDQLEDFITHNYDNPRILMIGFQPRLAEALGNKFSVKFFDMDKDNIGKKVNGLKIINGDHWQDYTGACDLIFATGSTFVNDTAKNFIMPEAQTIFYGVTCAGPCYLLDIPRYCPEGH